MAYVSAKGTRKGSLQGKENEPSISRKTGLEILYSQGRRQKFSEQENSVNTEFSLNTIQTWATEVKGRQGPAGCALHFPGLSPEIPAGEDPPETLLPKKERTEPRV